MAKAGIQFVPHDDQPYLSTFIVIIPYYSF